MFKFLFTLLLIFTAIWDIKTKYISPVVPLAVILLAPLYSNWNYTSGIVGLIFAGGILLLPALFYQNTFGGGDIKLAAACAYAVGFHRSITALFIAVTLSLIPCLYYKITRKHNEIAFAPYLAAGFLAVIF